MPKLSIASSCGRSHIAFLSGKLRAACVLIRTPLRSLSVALVNDVEMSALHLKYLGLRGPTDVLTFPLEMDNHDMAVAGEIVICVPEARRRAKSEGTTARNELLLYAIHGLLHLCGHDDRTQSGFQTMHREEDMLLTKLGVGPVFARPAKPRRRRA